MQYIITGTFHVILAPNELLTLFLAITLHVACAIFTVILLYIIIFYKLRDGTSGNLPYISGYLS